MASPASALLLLGACFQSCRIAPPATDDTAGQDSGPAVDTHEGPDDTAAGDDTASGDDTSTPATHTCGSGTADGWQPPVHTVVVFVTDGARIDETFGDGISSVTEEETAGFWPDIRDNLLDQGTVVLPAYATGVTITAEGHAEMLTGRRVAQANFPSDYGPGLYRPEYPTLFEAVRRTYGTEEEGTALVANTIHLCGHSWGLDPGYGESVGGYYDFLVDEAGAPVGEDTLVIDAIRERMTDFDVRMVLGNFHQIDRAGHYNSNPLAYADNVKKVDTPISEFWSWVQSTEPYADNTVMVVVADHGRHRWGSEEDFRNHGDHCAGCRQIPMFLIGAGIRQGAAISTPVTLDDLGATLGWLLGVDMPYATGQVACEVLDNPPADRGRSGRTAYAAVGDLTAWQTYHDEPEARSEVVVDGEIVSTAGSIHAEAPAVADSGQAQLACWREISIRPGLAYFIEDWEWTPRCLQRDAGTTEWKDVGFPVVPVSPYFQPSVSHDDGGRFWLAFADNDTGNWEAPDQVLRVLRKTRNGDWEGAEEGVDSVALPLDPSLALLGDDAYVAVTTSDEQLTSVEKKKGRYTRHIEVFHVSWPAGGAQTWTRVLQTVTAIDGTGDTGTTEEFPWGRMERPALSAHGGELQLAFVAYGDSELGTQLAWAWTTEGGQTWTDPEVLDDSGLVVGHVTPDWSSDGWVYWARLGDGGQALVCRASLEAPTPDCLDSGHAYVEDLLATDKGVVVSAAGTDRAWEPVELSWK